MFGKNRGEGWRLVVGITPLLGALMVALSRTSDYHHHWQGNERPSLVLQVFTVFYIVCTACIIFLLSR